MAAWPKNERGNDANVMERGEHEFYEVTYIRFEPLGGRNDGRRMKFDGEGRSYCSWWLGASIPVDSAEEKLGWRLGRVEEVVGNFCA